VARRRIHTGVGVIVTGTIVCPNTGLALRHEGVGVARRANAVPRSAAIVCTKRSAKVPSKRKTVWIYTRGYALAALLQRVHVGTDSLALLGNIGDVDVAVVIGLGCHKSREGGDDDEFLEKHMCVLRLGFSEWSWLEKVVVYKFERSD
jgi:hypothetical protein